MKVTIADVARACGVSSATVSLALSGRKTRISDQTAEMIRKTAEQMHYYPNIMASSLARQRSDEIGIVINDLRNTHISELFMSISSVIQSRGYFPICHVFNSKSSDEWKGLARHIAMENLCALIWAKPLDVKDTELNRYVCDVIERLDIPVFTMDDYEFKNPGINICCDYRKAAYMAVQYLISQGHRRIGCISGNQEFKVTQDRIEGYREALEEAGIPYDEKLIWSGDYSMESGRSALPYLLGQRVSAVFSMNDEMAFGVYQAARTYGLTIPGSFSIIGCDNVLFDDVLEVPLSTVSASTDDMGTFIGNSVCDAIARTEKDGLASLGERKTVYYEPDLYLRGSIRPCEEAGA